MVKKYNNYCDINLNNPSKHHVEICLSTQYYNFEHALNDFMDFFSLISEEDTGFFKLYHKVHTIDPLSKNNYVVSLTSSIDFRHPNMRLHILDSLNTYYIRYNEEYRLDDKLSVTLIFDSAEKANLFRNKYIDPINKSRVYKSNNKPDKSNTKDSILHLRKMLVDLKKRKLSPFDLRTLKFSTYISRLNEKTDKMHFSEEPDEYYSADFETVLADIDGKNLQQVYMAGYMHSSQTSEMSVNILTIDTNNLTNLNIKERSSDLIMKFINRLMDDMRVNKRFDNPVYFHNLGGFDGFFIINTLLQKVNTDDVSIIQRNNTYYQIKYKQLKFVDSYKVIPMSLNDASRVLNINISKLDFDHNKLNINNLYDKVDEIKIYIRRDVNLLRLLIKYNMDSSRILFPKFKYTSCLTIASYSFAIFRGYFLKGDLLIWKSSSNINYHNMIKESYRGGMTELYTPYRKNINIYDVNSSYPYCMLEYDMPVGKPKFIKDINIDNFVDMFGFFRVEVEVPKNTKYPLLGIKHGAQTIYPTGNFTLTCFSEELKYAIEVNKVVIKKFHHGLIFEREKLFPEFVYRFYKIKSKENQDKAIVYLSKLVLNSLYGRFGMGIDIKSAIIISEKDLPIIDAIFSTSSHQTEGINGNIIVEINVDNDSTYYDLLMKRTEDEGVRSRITFLWKKYNRVVKTQNIAVQISSAITSYARIHLYKQMRKAFKKKAPVLYIDTDSLATRASLEESKAIGGLKLEHTCLEVLYLASKVYILKKKDTDKEVIKFKGLPNFEKAMLQENKTISFENMRKFLSEDILFEHIFKRPFKKDRKKMEIESVESQYRTRFTFNKRIKIFDENGVWIDTKPINLKNNVICENISNQYSINLHYLPSKSEYTEIEVYRELIFSIIVGIIINMKRKKYLYTSNTKYFKTFKCVMPFYYGPILHVMYYYLASLLPKDLKVLKGRIIYKNIEGQSGSSYSFDLLKPAKNIANAINKILDLYKNEIDRLEKIELLIYWPINYKPNPYTIEKLKIIDDLSQVVEDLVLTNTFKDFINVLLDLCDKELKRYKNVKKMYSKKSRKSIYKK